MHLRNLLLVIVGGGIGSGARYLVSTWVLSRWGTGFPWGTLSVNVLGSFVLGVVMQLGLGLLGAEARILVTTGMLGGFTTYSTFNFETLRFAEHGNWTLFTANAAVTFFGCLVAGSIGAAAGRMLAPS
jgi:CrcB protein